MLDDDVYDLPLTQTAPSLSKKPKHNNSFEFDKDNILANPNSPFPNYSTLDSDDYAPHEFENCSLDFIPSTIDINCTTLQHYHVSSSSSSHSNRSYCSVPRELKGGYFGKSIESKLVLLRNGSEKLSDEVAEVDSDSELDSLLKLCDELEQLDEDCVICPLCEVDISNLTEEQRNLHTNDCLDKSQDTPQHVPPHVEEIEVQSVSKVSPVVDWLRKLGLVKYEHVFVREEVDFDTLQWLTEEDLLSMGVTALGPRKKIVHALSELRKGAAPKNEEHQDAPAEPRRIRNQKVKSQHDKSERKFDSTSKPVGNKLITEYFPGFAINGKNVSATPGEQPEIKNSCSGSGHKHKAKNTPTNRKLRDVPKWCSIPGTPFRVDAFKYLRGDCSHWFLTHFHLDHYQGLTKSFNHGKIYCSSITARLVNMNIGIPYDKLHVLPLNEKVKISDVDVTCLDANHCPGAVIILFQPANGKAVLHTGDFRFSEEIALNPLLRMCPIHTLILDSTYCNPQYDFPKQDAVIQFVIDAIQAESFNPKTLFLIGSYTIGKERLFLEVARALRKKVYVTAAKMRLLKCLEFQDEDMQWFTSNEHESNIHVAPMWTLASFKRLKHVSCQYSSRFSLIVAFSPTGWTFGKGKKKSPGRRWQQGTTIRYEVPYSEHSSFTELQEFVKLISPDNIIPSVNNDGPESADAMISLLLS